MTKNRVPIQHVSTPDQKPAKMAGFAFQSAAVNFVFVQNMIPNARLQLVTDDVSRRDVREFIEARTPKEHLLLFVVGLRNLAKLGGKRLPGVHVSIYDTPEVMSPFRGIRIVDAIKADDGSWMLPANASISVETVREAIRNAGYVPIHPERVREVLASAVAVIPTYDRNFKPEKAVVELFAAVREDYRETLQTSLWRFLAGINNRRNFSGTKRAAILRLKDSKQSESFKRLWSNLQSWFEDDTGGRKVTAAYQLLAAKKVGNTAVAAGRMNANMSVLNMLVRFIPPSRKLVFNGWVYTPGKGE